MPIRDFPFSASAAENDHAQVYTWLEIQLICTRSLKYLQYMAFACLAFTCYTVITLDQRERKYVQRNFNNFYNARDLLVVVLLAALMVITHCKSSIVAEREVETGCSDVRRQHDDRVRRFQPEVRRLLR